MEGASLPPEFCFHPTDEELVGYYLKRKVEGLEIELEVIPVIDLYEFDPWELPEKSLLPKCNMEWFFFCPRDRKYPNGSRTNRAARYGYWEATGKDQKVVCQSAVAGYRKTLVFYCGQEPWGKQTNWVMHEYCLCDDLSQGSPSFQGAFALCRVIKKNEHPQKTSDVHGKPQAKQVGSSSNNGDFTSTRISSEPMMISEKTTFQTSHLNSGSSFSSSLCPTTPIDENDVLSFWISPDLIMTSDSSKEVAPKCLDVYKHFSKQDEASNESFAAMDDIKEVLKVVCEANELLLAQAWVPCSLSMDVVDDGIVMSTIQSPSYYMDETYKNFLEACKSFHLREGQGVVGRALLSQSLLFCTDVTQFSIAEYPLAHSARSYDLRGCFAIYLQSSHLGNDVYVLEFFLPANTTGNLRASLRLILGAMNMFFQTSKLFSAENNLRKELTIEVIDIVNGEQLCYTLKPQTTRSLLPPEALQNRAEMMQPDSLDQQSTDLINNKRNVASGEQSDNEVTSSQEKGKLKTLDRPQSKTGLQISLKDLQQHAGMKLEDVAKRFKVSRSKLKRVCRDYNIPRWPPRKPKKDNFSLPIESVHGVDCEKILQSSSDLPSKHASATVSQRQHREPRGSTMQDANMVTIKARYANGITIKFPLSLSSGLVDLQQEVAKRLNLKDGTYYIKYKDEDNELILIACDWDLQNYIASFGLPGSTSITVFLEPK